MPFRIKDLIISVLPGRLEDGGTSGCCDSTSGTGCESTSGTGTVGSCTAEGCAGFGALANCRQSDEVLDPLEQFIDPAFMVELRLMLRLALAKGLAAKVSQLEAKLQPRTVQELNELEKQLQDALGELGQARQRLQKAP